MRVRVIFTLVNKGAVAPFHHQNILSEVIIKATVGVLPQSLCYSCLKGQTKVTSLGLSYFSTKVSLVMSSSEKADLDLVLNGIFAQKQIEVGQLILIPDSVSMEEPPKHEDQARYVCLSPLVAIQGTAGDAEAKRFISPDTDAFSDLLYESTMIRLEDSGRFSAEQIASFYKFQVLPDPNYLGKMRREEKKFARIYQLNAGQISHEIRGYTFPFTLYAHPLVQEFLFDNGLGEHCTQGFGMIDLAEQQFHNRMVPYYLEGQKPTTPERTFARREKVA